jgi:hypothetical protein
MGAYAILQLGPDALNLMGGRNAALRISDAIKSDLLHGDEELPSTSTGRSMFADAVNPFSLLSDD